MKKILDEIQAELNKEYIEYIKEDKFNNQIMMNSFLLDKLAEFEYRLRKLETANGGTKSF